VPHDSERLLNLRPILQVDPSHHIVDWTLSRNAETALARGQETSLIDICMPKQLTTATVGPVRPGLPSRERRASVLTLPSPCPYLQLKKAVKDQYRQIVLHIWDNLVECVQANREPSCPTDCRVLFSGLRLTDVKDIVIVGHGTGCEVRRLRSTFAATSS
jgi:hypothetical protein